MAYKSNASKINGVAITGTPSVGYVPTATSATAATWQAASGGASTPLLKVSTSFESLATRFDISGGGTATSMTNGLSILTLSSAGSYKQLLITASNVSYNNYTKSPSFMALVSVTNAPTTGDCYFGTGYVDVDGTGHTMTRVHHGFKIVYSGSVGTLYATNANGTTETATDVTAGVTLTNNNVYYSVQNGTTDVKYYINGTLVATHTTNLPATAPLIGTLMQWSVSNKSTATTMGLTVVSTEYTQSQ